MTFLKVWPILDAGSNREFTQTIKIHLCESIFYHYLQMLLMRMKLSFSFLKASPQYVDILTKLFFKFFTEKGVNLFFCGMLYLTMAILKKVSI